MKINRAAFIFKQPLQSLEVRQILEPIWRAYMMEQRWLSQHGLEDGCLPAINLACMSNVQIQTMAAFGWESFTKDDNEREFYRKLQSDPAQKSAQSLYTAIDDEEQLEGAMPVIRQMIPKDLLSFTREGLPVGTFSLIRLLKKSDGSPVQLVCFVSKPRSSGAVFFTATPAIEGLFAETIAETLAPFEGDAGAHLFRSKKVQALRV